MKMSSLVLACLMFSAACSKVKELDKRTENMEKATETMSSTTDEMKETTSAMYQQIRSKESEDTRDEKFSILMNDEADMGTRLTAACVFFKSLEFQLWTDNETYDNAHARDVLFLDAANEFTRRMTDLYSHINVNKMSPTKDNNEFESSFYAIAATMHMNHSYQDEAASKNSKMKINSFYDLMKKSLLKERDKRALDEHEEVLLQGINREIMIELIKARVDIMSALALKNLTDKRDMTLGQKAKGLLFKATGGRFGSIQLPEVFDKSNDATKIYTEKYLEGALKAKNFLKEIGIEKPLEKTVKSAFKHIDFNEKNVEVKDDADLDKKKESIKSLISELLN